MVGYHANTKTQGFVFALQAVDKVSSTPVNGTCNNSLHDSHLLDGQREVSELICVPIADSSRHVITVGMWS